MRKSSRKNFGGKWFELYYTYPTKSSAEDKKSKLKELGDKVRIVKSSYGFEVWYRE